MFRQFLAFFLLLLFCRIAAPEQALLALHHHEHTHHAHDEDVPHIDEKHTHCHVDNLYDAPFQPSLQHFVFAAQPVFGTPAFAYHSVWKFTFPNNIQLRGPPVA